MKNLMKNLSKEEVYMVITTLAAIVMAVILIGAYMLGVSDGEFTGYYKGRNDGYATGYDEGELDGMEDQRYFTDHMLKWSGETGYYFEREIDNKVYRVNVTVVEE